MIGICSMRCGRDGFTKRLSSRVEGTKKAEFCVQYAKDGATDIQSKRCGHEGFARRPTCVVWR